MGKLSIALKIAKFAGKQYAKQKALSALNSKGAHPLNPRDDCLNRTYFNQNSSAYKNKEILKECYNPKLPIDKEIKKWNSDDLFNAMESPLYKHDKKLQNMAKEYIKYRTQKNH